MNKESFTFTFPKSDREFQTIKSLEDLRTTLEKMILQTPEVEGRVKFKMARPAHENFIYAHCYLKTCPSTLRFKRRDVDGNSYFLPFRFDNEHNHPTFYMKSFRFKMMKK